MKTALIAAATFFVLLILMAGGFVTYLHFQAVAAMEEELTSIYTAREKAKESYYEDLQKRCAPRSKFVDLARQQGLNQEFVGKIDGTNEIVEIGIDEGGKFIITRTTPSGDGALTCEMVRGTMVLPRSKDSE